MIKDILQNLIFKQFNSKKGQIIIVYLMGLVALLVVVAMTINLAQKAGDSDQVIKEVLAEEVRIAVNALIAVPGDAWIKLPVDANYDISELTISLRGEFVEVKTSEDDDKSVFNARKVFHLPQGYDSSGTVREVNFLCLVKDDKLIKLGECD